MTAYRKEENLRKIKEYLLDPLEDYRQKDFADLDWVNEKTLRENVYDEYDDTETLCIGWQDYRYVYSEETGKKEFFWLVKGRMHITAYENQKIEILTMDSAISHNNHMRFGVLDGWVYTEYAEIPNKEYMYKKFYSDKYDSIEKAEEALIEKLEKACKEDEEREKFYETKQKVINNSDFFAKAELEKEIDASIDFKSFPVYYKDNVVGSGTLVEFQERKVNIAMSILEEHKADILIKFHNSSVGCDYDLELNDDDKMTRIKSMIIAE